MNFKSKPIILSFIIFVVIITTAAGFWYWSQRKSATPKTTTALFSELSPAEAKDTLGGQIIGKIQNPLKGELPVVNPFEKTETNPIKDIYVNPF